MAGTVLLFDIDGTLISTGGAGRRAMRSAFARLFGRPDACEAFSFAGMTDRAILRRALEGVGLTPSSSRIDELLAAYLEALEVELGRGEGFVVHPGVGVAIDACEAAGFAVGLGTGNVRPGAVAKLSRASLHQRFAFGGFGCDSEDRAELLAVGAARGAALLGLPRAECRVVVVGDTPKDVAAARAIGATCLAVATGAYDAGALLAAGADVACASLEAPEAMAVLLGSGA